MNSVIQNMVDFTETISERFDEMNEVQRSILSRFDFNDTEMRKIWSDIGEIPTLIIQPLVERLLLPHEDAN
jgi:hypothetical protein